jgi:hypothetical protein
MVDKDTLKRIRKAQNNPPLWPEDIKMIRDWLTPGEENDMSREQAKAQMKVNADLKAQIQSLANRVSSQSAALVEDAKVLGELDTNRKQQDSNWDRQDNINETIEHSVKRLDEIDEINHETDTELRNFMAATNSRLTLLQDGFQELRNKQPVVQPTMLENINWWCAGLLRDVPAPLIIVSLLTIGVAIGAIIG